MTEIKKEKLIRTPRNIDSIFQGALKLSLEERIALCRELKVSINKEVADREALALKGKELINGL